MKISVVVPVYNPGVKFKKCVKSILNQSHTDLELILVNDGSTDGSAELIDDFSRKDFRVKAFHKSNEGTIPTRRKGIELAASEFVTFVDSDDWIHPKMLEIFANELKQSEYDVVVCNTFRVLGEGRLVKQRNNGWYFDEDKVYEGEEIKKDIITAYFHGHPFPAALHGKIYRRDLLLQHDNLLKGFTILGDDLFYNMEILLHSKKIKVLKEPLYYYRLGGTTSKYMPNLFNDVVRGYEVQKQVAHQYYQDSLQSQLNGSSIMLINMLNRTVYGLFLGSLSQKEIMNEINKYLSNKYIQEATINQGVKKFFPEELKKALEEKDSTYFYRIGQAYYRKKYLKHRVMKMIDKIPVS